MDPSSFIDSIEGAADWSLQGCCNVSQIVFVSCFAAFLVIDGIFLEFKFMKPFKFISVFVHEMGHSGATWLTGGKVTKIVVNYDTYSGYMHHIGGRMCCILPAGYCSNGVISMIFIILSSDVIASTVAAIGFILALLVALKYAPNRMMVWLNLGFAAMTLLIVLTQWLVPGAEPGGHAHFPYICLVVLFYGTFIGSFGVFHVWTRTVMADIEGSDAVKCHEMCPIFSSSCIGFVWSVFCLFCMMVGVYFGLVWMGAHGQF